MEVGIGGRLDPTTVIPPPSIAVITSVALEHTAYLGDTHEKIAWDKSHIIKEKVRWTLPTLCKECNAMNAYEMHWGNTVH